jgi:hypothetical protein
MLSFFVALWLAHAALAHATNHAAHNFFEAFKIFQKTN